MKQQFDAILKEWSPLRSGDSTILRGAIYGDEAGRFRDGEAIRTSAVLDGSLSEGNIIQTRNTRYLLGKRAGTEFNDGHEVEDTTEDQIASLRGYMNARGYNMVYSDSSVYFRMKDPLARTPNNQVSFRTAVVWHNKAMAFTMSAPNGSARYLSTPEQMIEFRKVRKVKLQVTGNRIIVQTHKISYVTKAVDINELLDSL
jgi:hypothetical protein